MIEYFEPWGIWSIPKTRAELTVYWFMFGKRWNLPPQHFNCRCQSVGMISS